MLFMTNYIKFFVLFIIAAIIIFSCKKDKKEDEDPKQADCSSISVKYTSYVSKILESRCTQTSCHAAGSSNGDYTTYNGVKAVVSSGAFERRVFDENPTVMPPGGALPKATLDSLWCWLEKGAPK
jgi:hypothetical protein